MPPSPQEPDFYSAFQVLTGQNPPPQGFQANSVPPNTGLGTRQSLLQNNRTAKSTRQMMRWFIPDGPIIEMYLNPQNVQYAARKVVQPSRTKGGYVVQYWGPELGTISITGTTGTSGIEGINVLRDLYEAEQLAFDPYALALQAKFEQETFTDNIFGNDSALGAGGQIVDFLVNGSQANLPAQVSEYPSLAQVAFGIEMYWSGEVHRGFFTSFSYRESADNLGLFDYDISFTYTQRRGFRQNFLAWHRSAVNGPSNSNPFYGTPHSFGPLIEENQVPPRNT